MRAVGSVSADQRLAQQVTRQLGLLADGGSGAHRIRQRRPSRGPGDSPGDLPVRRLAGVCWLSVRLFRAIAAGAAALMLAACGGGPGRAGAPPSAVWRVYRHLPGVVDLAGPRGDGSFLVAAAGRLFVLGRDGTLSPFARGADGYLTATGTEPYLVLAGSDAVRGTSCSFGNDTAFALEPGPRPGVVMISPQGRARRFASLPPGRSLSGIAFDSTGRFGHRLLVTAGSGGRTTVFGIGCDGRLSVIAAGAPAVEGGITVAPVAFGRFGGDLIAADEASGRVYAVDPAGQVITVAQPGPAGRRRHRRGVRRVRAAASSRRLPGRSFLGGQQAPRR